MVDRREADLQTKLNEATNVDREKKEFLKNFLKTKSHIKANKSPKSIRKQINDRNASTRPSTTAAKHRGSRYASPSKVNTPSKSASASNLTTKAKDSWKWQ